MNERTNKAPDQAAAIRGRKVESFVEDLMSRAREAQSRWATVSLSDRLACVRELRFLISENSLALAEASASERGRPTLEALTAEVLPLAEACRFLEREAESILAPKRNGSRGRPIWLSGVNSEVRRDPFGVVLVIGPGNYPLLLPGVQTIQALVAGNAVLLKPGVGGACAARALIELIYRAGFDSHLVPPLPASTGAAQAAIAARPDKVLFTGSAATGEKILAQLAPLLIPATMELSGCDAVIVRPDADLDLVVKALTFGLTLNNGATCMAPKRVFVHRSIATELEGRLADSFSRRSGGNDTHTRLPQGLSDDLRSHINDALSQGAHLITGGISDDGTIQTPIVLAGVDSSAAILREDIFAPVLSLVTVTDDAEAISHTNSCSYALGASIFSRDVAVAETIAGFLNAGVVSINDLIVPTADARIPFGGHKRSGFGVTRGAEGLLDLTTPKVVTTSRSRFRPAFDAPDPNDSAMFQAYLKLVHGRGFRARTSALMTLFKSLSRRAKSSSQ